LYTICTQNAFLYPMFYHVKLSKLD